ncbi:MAG: hypothetical protein NZM31_03475 [Gemmatales bacterium]|nr:hypothetical protein [Gemmatales bacterium]MDW8386059.1 hypothetical protein [Gemmatales bacterium]
MSRLHLARFKVDTQIPLGHPLCGGWIAPAAAITEPLYAQGVVLLGEEAPIVLCAVDWCGINNDAFRVWTEKLAQAAHTTPERVAVHCVHQHNAPFADLAAEARIARQKGLSSSLDVRWFEQVVQRVAETIREALGQTEKVTHIGLGQAPVEKVASNRRVIGPDGKIRWWRGSSCRDAEARAQPEGLIDPLLKSVQFWNDDRLLAVLHYYACHPMSYYGDGLVTSDFVGLAREARTKETETPHLYFTGCAGDIAAGKYNDGDKPNRFLLARRIYEAMRIAEQKAERVPLGNATWKTQPIRLPSLTSPTDEELERTLADEKANRAVRARAAMQLSFRARRDRPIVLSCLRLGEAVRIVHLPGEPFVEFQLHAQKCSPQRFVAVAGYGDGGPWYIPTASAYAEGGYEPSASFVSPEAEKPLREALRVLLAD